MPYELKLATSATWPGGDRPRWAGRSTCAGRLTLDREIERLLHGDTREILVDLREVEFMDSIGLRSLVAAHRRALRAGVPLWLVRGGPPVARILRMTGLDMTLPMIDELPRRLQGPVPIAVAQRDMRISSGKT